MKIKFSLLLIILLANNLIYSQVANCKYTYIDSTSLVKVKLYKCVRVWVAKSFSDANNTIKMDDKDLGKIICKGIIPIEGRKPAFAAASVNDEYVSFTLTIDVKDKKYRIVYDELLHRNSRYPSSQGYVGGGDLCREKPEKVNGSMLGNWELNEKRWLKIKERVAAVIDAMNKELKTEISKSSKDEF